MQDAITDVIEMQSRPGVFEPKFTNFRNILIRCDGTNTALWQHKRKLHGLSCKTSVRLNGRAATTATWHAD
eukprot:468311-Pyramimonas_sp.AAC.1